MISRANGGRLSYAVVVVIVLWSAAALTSNLIRLPSWRRYVEKYDSTG